MTRTVPGRTTAIVAIGFLSLDAVLLAIGGVASGRPALLAAAGVCLLLAAAVVLLWKRYRRALADIAAARRAMRDEVKSLQALLHERSPHGSP
jgi:hypothetical protein